MKLSYTLSLPDVLAFNKVACQRLAVKTRTAKTVGGFSLNVLAWMAIAFTSAAYFSLYKKYPELSPDLTELLFAFGAAIVLLTASHLYRQRCFRELAFSDESWLRAPQSLSATAEGLEVATVGASARYDWSRFTDCVEDQTKLCLFLDTSCAVVVPKSAFGTSEDLNQFRIWVESANTLLQATRETRAPEQ